MNFDNLASDYQKLTKILQGIFGCFSLSCEYIGYLLLWILQFLQIEIITNTDKDADKYHN